MPVIPDLESFPGLVMHSHDYRHPEVFQGKHLVILGAASSGQNICLQAANHGRVERSTSSPFVDFCKVPHSSSSRVPLVFPPRLRFMMWDLPRVGKSCSPFENHEGSRARVRRVKRGTSSLSWLISPTTWTSWQHLVISLHLDVRAKPASFPGFFLLTSRREP